jgi:hypothetical protein
LQNVGIGLRIENINVNNTGCADDVALLGTQLSDAQIMVNMALDFANLEGYELQLKEANNYLDNPIKISRWISLVKSRVNDHWCTQLATLAQLYKGLQYLRDGPFNFHGGGGGGRVWVFSKKIF